MKTAVPTSTARFAAAVPANTAGVRELLRLADPDDATIDGYIGRGTCHGLFCEAQLIGVAVLLPQGPDVVELANMAIHPDRQGQGLGKVLLRHLIAEARKVGFTCLTVSTGNSSLGPLAFYQKAGFRITGVTPDYFTRHYPEPIEENGIPCLDQIHLNLKLNAHTGV